MEPRSQGERSQLHIKVQFRDWLVGCVRHDPCTLSGPSLYPGCGIDWGLPGAAVGRSLEASGETMLGVCELDQGPGSSRSTSPRLHCADKSQTLELGHLQGSGHLYNSPDHHTIPNTHTHSQNYSLITTAPPDLIALNVWPSQDCWGTDNLRGSDGAEATSC